MRINIQWAAVMKAALAIPILIWYNLQDMSRYQGLSDTLFKWILILNKTVSFY